MARSNTTVVLSGNWRHHRLQSLIDRNNALRENSVSRSETRKETDDALREALAGLGKEVRVSKTIALAGGGQRRRP